MPDGNLPVQHGLATDVPIDKAPTPKHVMEARLRTLSARMDYSVTFLRSLPEDTLKRLWDTRDDVISHTDEDGTTHVRDIVAGRGVAGGPIQSTVGLPADRAHGAIPAGKGGVGATAAGESTGPTRDQSGRFTKRS